MRCVTVCPAVSSQPNLLHPMTSIIWRETAPLPVECVCGPHGVVIGEEVFVVGMASNSRSDPVLVYDIARDSWDIHSWSPTAYAALTSYYSELVLIGGEEIASNRTTNIVLVWQDGEWRPSLPPMLLPRCRASVVSSSNYIIVAGGEPSPVSCTAVVEVFDGHFWTYARSLPEKCWCMKSVLNNDALYLVGGVPQGREVFKATVQSLVDSTQKSAQSPVWTRLPQAPTVLCSMAVFGSQLLVISTVLTSISAYFPHTQSWVYVENTPTPTPLSCSLTLPTGDLMVMAEDEAWIGQLEGMGL